MFPESRRLFPESLAACAQLVKEVSWKFHGSFMEVSWKFHGSFPAACAQLIKEMSWTIGLKGHPTVEDSVPSGQRTTNNKGAIFSKGKDIKALV
jgi:hypothetical protein